jgi:hypothetical protein
MVWWCWRSINGDGTAAGLRRGCMWKGWL